MKVRELIEKLQKFDDEMEVVIYDAEWGYFIASNPRIVKKIDVNSGFLEKRSMEIAVEI